MPEIKKRIAEYLLSNEYKTNKENNKELQKLINQFVKDFPLSKIRTMTMDEYVQGRGSKTSFSYRIEWELDRAGRISGSDVSKFGVYYSAKRGRYENTKKFGATPEEAFARVKEEIVKIIDAAQKNDHSLIRNSLISDNLCGKIYYLYSKGRALPIYSKNHLLSILSIFGIPKPVKNKNLFVYRDLLIKYKETHEQLKQWSNLEFSQFIYSDVGFNSVVREIQTLPEKYSVEVVDITALRAKSASGASGSTHTGPHDPERDRKKKAYGTRGEDVVLEYEQKENPKHAHLIKKVAGIDDGAGFDILSRDKDGKEVRIEVKTKAGGNINNIYFFISRNQLDKLRGGVTDYIYYVFGLGTRKVQIVKITNAMLKQSMLIPHTYVIDAVAII